jgi:hypothetical protein
MKQYISEEEAMYEDLYHGNFSRKLALWAIDRMEKENPTTGKLEPITRRSFDDVMEIMKANNVNIPDEHVYSAYYLYHMTLADYPESLPTDKHRAKYVEETLCDPDGEPRNVPDCFVTKMCNAGVPIYWERFL